LKHARGDYCRSRLAFALSPPNEQLTAGGPGRSPQRSNRIASPRNKLTTREKKMKLTLISHPLCPYVQRAVIALKEKHASYERIDIDLNAKPAWFLELSPTSKTPLLLTKQRSSNLPSSANIWKTPLRPRCTRRTPCSVQSTGRGSNSPRRR
jgi:hypothetical protein